MMVKKVEYDEKDIGFIIDNHDEINENISSILRDIEGYENLIHAYDWTKAQLLLKELVPLDIYLKSLLKNLTIEERKRYAEDFNIKPESLEEMIRRVI